MVNHVLEPFFNIAENVGVNDTENDSHVHGQTDREVEQDTK